MSRSRGSFHPLAIEKEEMCGLPYQKKCWYVTTEFSSTGFELEGVIGFDPINERWKASRLQIAFGIRTGRIDWLGTSTNCLENFNCGWTNNRWWPFFLSQSVSFERGRQRPRPPTWLPLSAIKRQAKSYQERIRLWSPLWRKGRPALLLAVCCFLLKIGPNRSRSRAVIVSLIKKDRTDLTEIEMAIQSSFFFFHVQIYSILAAENSQNKRRRRRRKNG